MPADDSTRTPADSAAIYRVLDANRNRCLEGLRVVEDGLRFVWEDRHLVNVCKQLRHDLVDALEAFPQRGLHASRDTLGDVGTSVTTAGEYRRENIRAVVAANWSRAEQRCAVWRNTPRSLLPKPRPGSSRCGTARTPSNAQ